MDFVLLELELPDASPRDLLPVECDSFDPFVLPEAADPLLLPELPEFLLFSEPYLEDSFGGITTLVPVFRV